MNNFVKINEQTIALWSQILLALPESRLLVLIPGGANGNDHVPAAFARHGIAASRLTLEPHRGVREYLDLFNQIDIALDSFPFGGHTTTCDALWMGVPVVTLAGATYPGRMSASVLTCMGLTQWIACTPDEYVRTVLTLAGDTARLRVWHEDLRARFTSSPAMDGAGFTHHLEAAYRQMWRHWCAGGQS
jgi:protein O-GlcNAc transferase